MEQNRIYAIDHDQVAHNDFGDELVVIHFASGCYFSLRDTAAALWKQLALAPASPVALSHLFAGAPAQSTVEIGNFLHELTSRGLLVETNAPVGDDGGSAFASTLAFETPRVEIFDDLQQLLIADVIHDTDEQGWPRIAPDQAA